MAIFSASAGARQPDWRVRCITPTLTFGQLLSMVTLMGYQQPLEGEDYGGWSNTG
jgi:hypothetical protein